MIQRLIGILLLALCLAACSSAPMKDKGSMKSPSSGVELPEIAPYDDPPIPPLDTVSDIPDAV